MIRQISLDNNNSFCDTLIQMGVILVALSERVNGEQALSLVTRVLGYDPIL